MPLPSVYTICPNGDGRVWMGGYHFGAVLYNPSTNSAIRFARNEGVPESLAGNMIWFIYRDNHGNTWFGTNNGLSKLNALATKTIHLRKIPYVNSLPSNQVTSILPDYPNGIWIGTQNKGLAFYHYGSKSFNRFGYFNFPDSIGTNWVTSVAKTPDNTLLLTLWNGRGEHLTGSGSIKSVFSGLILTTITGTPIPLSAPTELHWFQIGADQYISLIQN